MNKESANTSGVRYWHLSICVFAFLTSCVTHVYRYSTTTLVNARITAHGPELTTKVEYFYARGWKHDGFPLFAKPKSEYGPSKIERVEWKTLKINKAGHCASAVTMKQPPGTESRAFSNFHLWSGSQLVGRTEKVHHITYVSHLHFTSPDPRYLWSFDVYHWKSNIWEMSKAESTSQAPASWWHETVPLKEGEWYALEKTIGDSESQQEPETKNGTYQHLGLKHGIPTLRTQTYYFDKLTGEQFERLDFTEVQWLKNSGFALGKHQSSKALFIPGQSVFWPIIDGVAGYYQTAPESIMAVMKDGVVHFVTFENGTLHSQRILPPLGIELTRGQGVTLYYEPKAHVLTQLSRSGDAVVFMPDCLKDIAAP